MGDHICTANACRVETQLGKLTSSELVDVVVAVGVSVGAFPVKRSSQGVQQNRLSVGDLGTFLG